MRSSAEMMRPLDGRGNEREKVKKARTMKAVNGFIVYFFRWGANGAEK